MQDGIVQLLLKYWADPNAKDGSEPTTLHIATENNNVIVIKLLLDSGRSLAQNNKGYIPASKTLTSHFLGGELERYETAVSRLHDLTLALSRVFRHRVRLRFPSRSTGMDSVS